MPTLPAAVTASSFTPRNGANPETAKACAVYVSNADSGDISVLRLDLRSGALAPLQQAMVGGQVMPLAISPGRRFLYAARRSEPLALLSFAIDPASGRLSPLGEAPLPDSMAYIAVDRSGRFLLSASYGASAIAVSAIAADGVAGAVQQRLATPPHAHAIQVDPSNHFAFATSLGGGAVLQLRFDAATGRLAPHAPPLRDRAGASPRHVVLSAGGRGVYLINELDAAIDVLGFDAEAGSLRALQTVASLPPGFIGEPWAADLHLTPDGRFLYSCERRSSSLAAFAVDPRSGHLTPLGHTPTEAQPRAFQITADGRFLLAAGQLSHRVSAYAIAADGALSRIADCAVGQNPNWIEIVALDA